MSKLLTVVGGTGTQGLSIINAVLEHNVYKIRALTRNPSSERAKALISKGVEVVQAEINSEDSLLEAFAGSHAIYAITDFFEPFAAHGPEKAVEIESAQGINLAKAASKTATLEHYIWSTLSNGARLTNGKFKVPHFVAKNRVDDYIKSDKALFAKTTFLWITFYANNYQYPMFTPIYVKTAGQYIQLSPAKPDTPIKSIGDPLSNIGVFVAAILKQPQLTLPGRFVVAYQEETTTGKLLQDWAEATGNKAKYVQTSLEEFSEVWPMWGLEMGAMMKMWDECHDHWSGEEGLVTPRDLGVDTSKLVGVKEAYKMMDWGKLL